MIRRQMIFGLLAAAMFAAGIYPSRPIAAPAAPIDVGTIGGGQSVFWDGGYVGSSPTHSLPIVSSNSNLDRCANFDPCFTYRLNTLVSGLTLRIALDTPSRDDGFEMTIVSPTGQTTRKANSNQYSIESFVPAPPAGAWKINVAPYSADYASFRMRAKLETTPYQPTPNADGLLLPDLRPTRMWEFGFVAPANPANGVFPPDDLNPPLDVAGNHPISCSADETINDGVQRCLRFSFGLANAGGGPFDIRYVGDRTGNPLQMMQCIVRSNGTVVSHPAGIGQWHMTHGHYHYNDIIYHELLKVADRTTGSMTPAGNGKKLGYSPADQAIADWNQFVQSPTGSSRTPGNCAAGTDQQLGMSPGWGDAYRYQRPGNYVDFGNNGDGYYVVRTIADPLNNVLESDETDNVAYAYVHVVGDQVQVLETGRGTSPWDPNRVLFE